jgi:hypothetical protein
MAEPIRDVTVLAFVDDRPIDPARARARVGGDDRDLWRSRTQVWLGAVTGIIRQIKSLKDRQRMSWSNVWP